MVAAAHAETAGFLAEERDRCPTLTFQTKSFHLTLVAMLNEQVAYFVGVLTRARFIAGNRGRVECAAARIVFIAILLAPSCLPARAADETPSARTVQRGGPSLERTATVQWQRVPLQNALSRLKPVFLEPVFVDRRVDPAQRVSLEIEGATFSEVLQKLSAASSLGYSEFQSIHYLGPTAAAEQLRTVAAVRRAEAGRLPARSRAALELKQAVTWPRLTEPRQLITSLVERRGWRIDHAERIPHDLWAAGELPSIAFSDQLTLLLIGFDLTFEIKAAGQTLEIVPLKELTIRREYELPTRSSNAIEPLRQVLGEAKSHRLQEKTLIVDARVEQHERLAELLRGRSPAAPVGDRTRQTKRVFTLRVEEQPVGAVLNELASRLGWSLEIDSEAIRAAGLSLDRRVSFSVENGDEDELLEAALSPAGLDYGREGKRLRIVPRGEELE
jgi:hypothetical protein